MYGRRSAASSGGRIAFSTAMAAAATNAAPVLCSATPGTIHAATAIDAADTAHATATRTGRRRGICGSHAKVAP